MIDAQRLNQLLNRYEGYGPRYTSYPTALHFNDEFNLSQYKEQVGLSNEALMPRARALYVHVPFCAFLCLPVLLLRMQQSCYSKSKPRSSIR